MLSLAEVKSEADCELSVLLMLSSRQSYFWGLNNYIGGSLVELWYNGPQNSILFIL